MASDHATDATEDRANNFIALRRIYSNGDAADALYAKFLTGDQGVSDIDFDGAPGFVEYYEMGADPEQLTNLQQGAARRAWPGVEQQLREWHGCAGASCP